MDMSEFNATFPHLSASEYMKGSLSFFIGKTVRYLIPQDPSEYQKFLSRNGTNALDAYKVVGLQRNFKGETCLRAVNTTFDDQFGRCISFNECILVDC